jgi:hypothetical protein
MAGDQLRHERIASLFPLHGTARGRAHFAAAKVGLKHARLVANLQRRAGTMITPASSDHVVEIPMTSFISCSTRMTVMPRSRAADQST